MSGDPTGGRDVPTEDAGKDRAGRDVPTEDAMEDRAGGRFWIVRSLSEEGGDLVDSGDPAPDPQNGAGSISGEAKR